VRILRVRENAATARRRRDAALLPGHINLRAAITASTVIAKLTQGPQSIAPAITTIAKRGQNDLPSASRLCDRNACERSLILRFFPLRFALQRAYVASARPICVWPQHASRPSNATIARVLVSLPQTSRPKIAVRWRNSRARRAWPNTSMRRVVGRRSLRFND